MILYYYLISGAVLETAPISESQSDCKLSEILSLPVSWFLNSMKTHIVLEKKESSNFEDDFSPDTKA